MSETKSVERLGKDMVMRFALFSLMAAATALVLRSVCFRTEARADGVHRKGQAIDRWETDGGPPPP